MIALNREQKNISKNDDGWAADDLANGREREVDELGGKPHLQHLSLIHI